MTFNVLFFSSMGSFHPLMDILSSSQNHNIPQRQPAHDSEDRAQSAHDSKDRAQPAHNSKDSLHNKLNQCAENSIFCRTKASSVPLLMLTFISRRIFSKSFSH